MKVLPLRDAYPFGESHGFGKEMGEIRDMEIEWDAYTSSLRRGYVVELFEQHHILEEFINKYWPDGLTAAGMRYMRFCRNIKNRYTNFLKGQDDEFLEQGSVDVIEETDEDREFAAETDLRDFLALNPECIESGLRIYEGGGRRGVEYVIDEGAGRIDLLAVDKRDQLVVIELKVSRGRNKTLGQILYYMGWVNKNLTKKTCRGIIIAKEITDDLRTAVNCVPSVALMRYRLSFSLETVRN